MAYNIKISKFSSLNFSEWKNYFQTDTCYVQKFAPGDTIRCQLSLTDDANVSIKFKDHRTGEVSDVNIVELLVQDNLTTYYFEYTGLDFGRYEVFITNYWYEEKVASCVFDVMPPDMLQNTVLFRYENREDRYDTVFLNGDNHYSFDFRVEGGFLFSEIKSQVNNNTFRDQSYRIYQLSAYPYQTKTLTLGTSRGVPWWVAEKVNLIFSLSDVLIGDDIYTRSEGSSPEVTEIDRNYPLYVIKMDVEPAEIFSEQKKKYPDTYFLVTEDRLSYITTEDSSRITI